MPPKHQCGYCCTTRPTAQGIHSHIAQSRECAKQLKICNTSPSEASGPNEEDRMTVDQPEVVNPEVAAPTMDFDDDL